MSLSLGTLLTLALMGCTASAPIDIASPVLSDKHDSDCATCTSNRRAFNCVQFHRNYTGDTVAVNIPSMPLLLGEKIPVITCETVLDPVEMCRKVNTELDVVNEAFLLRAKIGDK